MRNCVLACHRDNFMATQLPAPFGKYILLNKIALGGMAEIFRAKTIGAEGFEKEVVIKRILPHFTEDEAFVTMFIDEAKVSAKLNHRNIVQIYDFDKQDDTYYIAMEYVEGKDLKRLMDTGVKTEHPLNVGQIATIMMGACEGLHHAHTKTDRGQPLNIIHRDVSPHNIMVSYNGDVKVMDFGIAKAAARSTKTRAGTVKGKCAYMSPEQARGKNLDPRSDLFALGVIMWEALTHRRLFAGDSDFETLSNVLKAEVPPPSSLNDEVPPEIDEIVLKALEKDRDNRFKDCKAMLQALQGWFYTKLEDKESAELAPIMKTLFDEDIRALREMQQADHKTSFVQASELVRAQRQSSQPSMQRAESQPSQPAVSLNDARTMAIDVGDANEIINNDSTLAVDAASGTGLRRDELLPPKSKAPMIVVALLLIAGLGAGGWYFFGRDTGKTTESKPNTPGTTTEVAQNTDGTDPADGEDGDDGNSDGKADEAADGKADGTPDGKADGTSDEKADGTADGTPDGKADGTADGKADGQADSEDGADADDGADDQTDDGAGTAGTSSTDSKTTAGGTTADTGGDDGEAADGTAPADGAGTDAEGTTTGEPQLVKARVTITALPTDAVIKVGANEGRGHLIVESHVGAEIAVAVTHPDYKPAVQVVKIDNAAKAMAVTLEKKPTDTPSGQLAVLKFTVSPKNAKLEINGQKHTGVDGVFTVQGYKIGEDVHVRVIAPSHHKHEDRMRITSANFERAFELQKIKIQPRVMSRAKFNAKPWARVTVSGKSCQTPCAIDLMTGRYTAKFKGPGGRTKKKGFRVRAGRTASVFVDLSI